VGYIVTYLNQTNKQKILIIDDDVNFSKQLSEYLNSNGFDVAIEHNGSMAIQRIDDEKPDLIMLELNVPGENGLTICKLSRQLYTGPIMMLSHRADELDQVLGLDMGADEYLSKTVSNRLMLARAQALLRRHSHEDTEVAADQQDRLKFGELTIDNTMREAWLGDETIELTSAEFDLLWLLSSHAGEILTREEIFHQLRGIESDGQDRSVDVRVSRIRPKVGDDPLHPRRIKTVRSKGYLFVADLNHMKAISDMQSSRAQ